MLQGRSNYASAELEELLPAFSRPVNSMILGLPRGDVAVPHGLRRIPQDRQLALEIQG
jgi:hypothetical protein